MASPTTPVDQVPTSVRWSLLHIAFFIPRSTWFGRSAIVPSLSGSISDNTHLGPALDTENAFCLLELQAGQTDDPVTVRLLACSFGTVSYEAVSYIKEPFVSWYILDQAPMSDEAMHWIREIDQPSDYGAEPSCEERPRAPSNMDSFRALFQRPWFRRVWVLQEIAFAQDAVFVCGPSEVSWDSIRAFHHFNQSEHWVERGLAYSVEYAVRRSNNRIALIHYNHRLCKLLMDTKDCRATDPRDKLYAMLHLLHWDHEEMVRDVEANQDQFANDNVEKRYFQRLRQATYIQADYEQSVQQVYTKLTIILLEHFGLRVLQRPFESLWPGDASPDEGPSFWAASQLCLNEKEPKEELHVRALRIDKIAFIGGVCNIYQDIFPLKQWTSLGFGPKWWHQETRLPTGVGGGFCRHSKALTPFMETLVAGDTTNASMLKKAIETVILFNESNDASNKVRLVDLYARLEASADEQLENLFNACDGRRFFITDTGHIGLAPETATIGDLTFEVQGCRVPYVMRPCPDAGAETSPIVSGQAEISGRNTRNVTMIGECWIHGMMGKRSSEGLEIRNYSSYPEDLIIY
ncbi:hypothetical protein BJ166DRAFT_583014 [Pestalotiopsis sp. NC0098]|nr:hypothetical protein BJ166DRAFT_583014 [Pestalotiopsis sp. NC0098]